MDRASRRSDQFAGREPIAIEVGLLAQRVGGLGQAPADELQRAGPGQPKADLRPCGLALR